MRKFIPIAFLSILLAACQTTEPEPKGTTITFTESQEVFPNPERGLFSQTYFTSADLTSHASAAVIDNQRTASDKMTLYLHSYYLTDYMECDIPQAFLDRLETNMNALREGGGKVIVRFSYKSSMDAVDRPWDTSPEWVHRHIDQVAPYLQKHADVILCAQCGWIGSWGEWYYTSGFKMNPSKDEDFEPRWAVLEHMLRALPEDRQVALRTPEYKMRYLKMRGDTTMSPIAASEAYNGSAKSRICGHNDCFVSSANDVGTYNGPSTRTFWAEDTKYTFMGGETCAKSSFSDGANAIAEMEKYHWTYINRAFYEKVTSAWRADGTMQTMIKRLGYRFVLDKVIITPEPKLSQPFEMYCVLRNVGFAAPHNPRDVEMILVSVDDPTQIKVFEQKVDPRLWLTGEHKFTLAATLNDMAAGQYKLYLNLPDPYESIHDDPRYAIRLANDNMWDETTGYNYITTITVQ